MADHENGRKKINGGDVELQSVLTVVSSTPVNPPDQVCPLTPLDRAMGQHSVHVIFYFRSGSIDFDGIRPALNEVLTLYPNVIGRLAKDEDGNWVIRCTDAGVRVHRAKVGTSVDEWLRSASANDEKFLTLRQDMPDDPKYWAPYRMQVYFFNLSFLVLFRF